MGVDIDAQAMAFRALGRSERNPCGALSTVKAMLNAGHSCNLGIWTDSVSNEGGACTDDSRREWPYLFADRLAAAYPAYKVQVIRWPLTGATAYESPAIAIAAGQGSSPPTLTLYNAAVAGSSTMYFMGSSFMAALGTPSLDALIIAHGANHKLGLNGVMVPANDPIIGGEFVAAIEQFRQCRPGVPIDVLIENPRRDDDLMAPVHDAWTGIAQRSDIGVIDVYAAFIAAGKPVSWYQSTGDAGNNNVHPNQVGENVYRDELWKAFQSAEAKPCWSSPSLFQPATMGANLLANGGFTQWTNPASAPDGSSCSAPATRPISSSRSSPSCAASG